MKRFMTLLWLEHRRNWIWSLSLLGSLIFWAWGIKQVTIMDVGERLGVRAGLLLAAAAIGAVVLCLMIGRIRSETRNGQYQVLLLTPPSGYTHVLARFTYGAGVAMAYYIALGFLFWWIFELAGVHLDARSLFDLIVSTPIYGMSCLVFPVLAYVVLLMVFISAYRVSGPGWVPGVTMLFATPFLLNWLGDGIGRILWSLPGWQLFATAPDALTQRFGDFNPDVSVDMDRVFYAGAPLEPMLVMLAVSAILLLIAGRIWQEVEA
jgi:hypothetical protein